MNKKSLLVLFALVLACVLVLSACDNGSTSPVESGPSLPAGAVAYLTSKGAPVFPPPEGLKIDAAWNEIVPAEGFEIGYKDGNEDLFDAYMVKITSILGLANQTDDDPAGGRHIVKFFRNGLNFWFAFSRDGTFDAHGGDLLPENMILITVFEE